MVETFARGGIREWADEPAGEISLSHGAGRREGWMCSGSARRRHVCHVNIYAVYCTLVFKPECSSHISDVALFSDNRLGRGREEP